MIKKLFLRVSEFLRRRTRNGFLRLVRTFGPMLVDEQTGEKLGRALIVPWGRRIFLIGVHPERSVRVIFVPQPHLPYLNQVIGFVAMNHNPDYPSLPAGSGEHPGADRARGALAAHLSRP